MRNEIARRKYERDGQRYASDVTDAEWALRSRFGACITGHGKHLQSYFDEFVIRFNSRRTRHGTFRSLLGIVTGHQAVPYKILISPEKRAQGFRCIQSP